MALLPACGEKVAEGRMRGCLFALFILLCTPSAFAAPQRIVTLAPNCAEIVAALGLGDALAGVTDYTDWPPRAASLPHVGSYVEINVEAVAALRPDLVVATDDGNPPAALHRLEQAGLRVVTLRLRDFGAIEQSILSLGRTLGRDAEARRTVAEMQRVAGCVAQRTRLAEKPRVLFAYQLAPIVSAGKGTFTDELLTMAGGRSITSDVAQSYPRMNIESVVARAPEVIVVSSMDPSADASRGRAWLQKWPSLPAVQHDRLYFIDGTNLDRPSQRIVRGLTLLARTIHPALFAHGECETRLP